jgi:hypothetical protein
VPVTNDVLPEDLARSIGLDPTGLTDRRHPLRWSHLTEDERNRAFARGFQPPSSFFGHVSPAPGLAREAILTELGGATGPIAVTDLFARVDAELERREIGIGTDTMRRALRELVDNGQVNIPQPGFASMDDRQRADVADPLYPNSPEGRRRAIRGELADDIREAPGRDLEHLAGDLSTGSRYGARDERRALLRDMVIAGEVELTDGRYYPTGAAGWCPKCDVVGFHARTCPDATADQVKHWEDNDPAHIRQAREEQARAAPAPQDPEPPPARGSGGVEMRYDQIVAAHETMSAGLGRSIHARCVVTGELDQAAVMVQIMEDGTPSLRGAARRLRAAMVEAKFDPASVAGADQAVTALTTDDVTDLLEAADAARDCIEPTIPAVRAALEQVETSRDHVKATYGALAAGVQETGVSGKALEGSSA